MTRLRQRTTTVIAVTAAFSIAWYARTHGAQQPGALPVVCMGADRLLRGPVAGATCGPGERVVLGTLGAAAKEPKDATPVDPNVARINALEDRVRQLERELGQRASIGAKVTAPFEVLDEGGKRLFVVGRPFGPATRPGAYLYNTSGQAVALMSSGPAGGIVRALSDTDQNTSVGIGISSEGPGIIVREADKVRLELGKTPSGRFGLRVTSAGGTPVAGFGESQAGSGVAIIYSANGEKRALMSVVESGKGQLSVVGESGNEIISLVQGASGGGKLEISNASGALRVEAGVNPSDTGVVRAGPEAFPSVFGGFPVSFIVGKK
jgi:hypothetical protein